MSFLDIISRGPSNHYERQKRLGFKREYVKIYLEVFSLGIIRSVNNCQGRSLESEIFRNERLGDSAGQGVNVLWEE